MNGKDLFNPRFSNNGLKHPCVKDCPDRKAACAVTCEKWKRYVEERDKVYKKRVKETERGRP